VHTSLLDTPGERAEDEGEKGRILEGVKVDEVCDRPTPVPAARIDHSPFLRIK
jgi:hypothetical protein